MSEKINLDRDVNEKLVIQGHYKFFKQWHLRELEKMLATEEITHSRMVELINELAYDFYKETVKAVGFLWDIIDDIDSTSDVVKSDDKAYRANVEFHQKKRWETGITTNGYILDLSKMKIPEKPDRTICKKFWVFGMDEDFLCKCGGVEKCERSSDGN